LGIVLQINHHDSWLSDFLNTQQSSKATEMLYNAVFANKKGDLDGAIKEADAAIRLFHKTKNQSGVLRSQFERLYALRRKSQGQKCSEESAALDQAIHTTNYSWLQIQILLERASCLAMSDNLDDAWGSVARARVLAKYANYQSLQLRAVAMEAALHSNEGRLAQAWNTSETGLALFFDNAFASERGFQFYSELEFSAEQAGQWHLAALLQKEAIFYIRSLGRLDFEATANFHLAAVEEALGNRENAKNEIAAGQQIFQQLPSGTSQKFLEAESRIALASLEVRFGSPTAAAAYIAGLDSIVSQADNFTVRLEYEQTMADIQRKLGREKEEARHLRRCIQIGNKGFSSLKSPRDRWDWERTLGRAYRRLIEIQVAGPHRPIETLVAWERYRATSSSADSIRMSGMSDSTDRLLLAQIKHLHSSSAVVFATLSDQVVAWIADDRGVREVKLPVNSKDLTSLVKTFYSLCSTPKSSLEKVKSDGLRLYQLLLSPLDRELALRHTVIIESDEALGEVPWNALTMSNGMYLSSKFEIVSMPTLTAQFSVLSQQTKKGFLIAYPGAATVGGELYPSLVHAQREANLLAKNNADSVYLEGEDATLQKLAENLRHARQFHFAGHSLTREFGGELIVHGTDGSQLVSATTIASLDLRGLELAVLAACNTGSDIEASRNPNGLVGAFILAGTHRVVASSWAVDSEATSDLMSEFYAALNSKRDKGSVEKAWQESLSHQSALHPYYWAGFQVFGPLN
jgi:CHAT domain-containing protein